MVEGILLARASSVMIYRKHSPTPPRLLLRIVGTAGAGALLGAAACSSSSAPPVVMGVVPNVETDGAASDAAPVVAMTGSVACLPDATDGVVGCPDTSPDASADAHLQVVTGIVVSPSDASIDDANSQVVTGLVVSPSDASDDVIFNGLVAHPGDSG
jgi:hypothetical protein